MRLVSNLVLTRLLFPEAFGLMAIVTVGVAFLQMVSDTGVVTAIQQNKHGDDPRFLHTAWTIQIIRGGVLWLLTFPLGVAMGAFYEQPMLAQLMPAVGITLIIAGLKPTRVYTAQRHLQIGRLTIVELATAFISLIVTIAFAWWLKGVWALVIGQLVSQSIGLVLLYRFLHGKPDRLLLDRDFVKEQFNFGKWLMLSTICAFLNKQGDRLVLGKFLALNVLGIYTIAFFLASVPMLLASAVFSKVMVPFLREKPPSASRENFLALRRIRLIGSMLLISLVILLSIIGPNLVNLLYESRYYDAGGMLVLICVSSLPVFLSQGYGMVPLTYGESRKYAAVTAMRTVLNVTFLLIGVNYAGLVGAIIGFGVGRLLNYPVLVWALYRYKAWDPLLDAWLLIYGTFGCGIAVWMNWDHIVPIVPY